MHVHAIEVLLHHIRFEVPALVAAPAAHQSLFRAPSCSKPRAGRFGDMAEQASSCCLMPAVLLVNTGPHDMYSAWLQAVLAENDRLATQGCQPAAAC